MGTLNPPSTFTTTISPWAKRMEAASTLRTPEVATPDRHAQVAPRKVKSTCPLSDA